MAESSLLPVLSALGGVALAQGVAMLQSWFDRQNKRDILLRTKYEELGLYYLESMKLPGALMLCKTREETLSIVLQPDGNKMHLLALVYFPLLRDATGKYIDSYSDLCEVAMSLYDPKDNRPFGMQILSKQEYVDASNAHAKASNTLQNQIELHSVTYVKA